MSFRLTNPQVLLRGTHNSAGKVPLEVAEMMRGKQFKTFDEFRGEFWKSMAKSKYASEFGEANLDRMIKGKAPVALESQQIGGRKSYELHHQTPIHDGGSVYDLSNILVVTPKYHLEILDKATHFGGK